MTNDLVNDFMKVLTQVETIRHLNGMRSTQASRFGIRSRPVTADDLDRRGVLEPRCHRGSLPVRKNIESAVPFEVTDDCPISTPATPSPIIQTDHTRWFDRIVEKAAEQTQKRVRATDHSQDWHEARGWFPSQS